MTSTSTTTGPGRGGGTTRPRPGPSRSPRVTGRVPSRPSPTGSPLRAGLPAALWALAAGLAAVGLPVLLVWAADARTGASGQQALRAAGRVWLLAQTVPLDLPAGRLSLAPLGLLGLPLALLVRAGAHAARQHGVCGAREAAQLAAAVAGPYGLTTAVVASLCAGDGVAPDAVQALVRGSLVGLLGAGVGVIRGAGLRGALVRRLPPRLARTGRPLAAVLLALTGVAALLAAACLCLALPRAAALARTGAPGLVGGVALLGAGLALVPTAVVWGLAFLAGPGFAVGAGTAVGPFGVAVGAVPALPLLAALPDSAPPAWAGWLAPAVVVAVGAIGGLLALRGPSPRATAASTGAAAGVLTALAAWLAQGAAGGTRLAHVGPSVWQTGLAVAAAVAVGALAAVEVGLRRGR